MSTRHRLSYSLECTACHTEGVALVIELSGPPFRADPVREYKISAGYQLRAKTNADAGLEIECSGCGALAA